MQFYEFKDIEERVILIGVQTRMSLHLLMSWKNWQRLPVQ